MAATVAGICNRALQKVGAGRILSIDQDSDNARACAACYEPVRDALLRSHNWNFAVKRAELAAESPAPTWGRANAFPLPSDFIKLLPDYPEDNSLARDYIIEGRKILSDYTAPLYIRYLAVVTDPTVMDPIFRELLAHMMAIELCEPLTQSNTKKAGLVRDLKDLWAEARKANAFEKPAAEPPTDPWIEARR